MADVSLRDKAHNHAEPFMVTIDGASATGKSTIAKLLAQHFSLYYFQTSLLYRAVAAFILGQNVQYNDSSAVILAIGGNIVDIIESNEFELYAEQVSHVASIIAAYPEVRALLLQYQHDMKMKHKRLILEGRDTGTVIAPEADLKIFVTADLAVRAERRYKQLQGRGEFAIISDVRTALQDRDHRDMTRATAPLVQAAGALELDNSNVSLDEIISIVENYITTH